MNPSNHVAHALVTLTFTLGVASACPRARILPPIRKRGDLGPMLNALDLHGPGVELGVQRGWFTSELLAGWRNTSLYVQVDAWQAMQNYVDVANKDGATQMNFKEIASSTLRKMVRRGFARRGIQCHNFTTVCARHYPPEWFDFIYVDARHDRTGVLEDLANWWPKLRKGGVIAGHDYTTQAEPAGSMDFRSDPNSTGQDWTINSDGTIDTSGRVVKGAVDDFFAGLAPAGHRHQSELRHCPLQVVVTYREMGWNTWMVAKPWGSSHAGTGGASSQASGTERDGTRGRAGGSGGGGEPHGSHARGGRQLEGNVYQT